MHAGSPRDQTQIVVSLGVAGRDHVALPGEPRERGFEIATADGSELDLLTADARGRENVDKIGVRVGVVAAPDLGLLEGGL